MNKKFIALTILALGIYSTGYGAQPGTPKAPPAKQYVKPLIQKTPGTLAEQAQQTRINVENFKASNPTPKSYADQARAGLKRAGLALESFASGVQQSAKDFYNNPKQSVTKAASATGVALRDTASAVYNAPGQLSARLGGQKDFITGTQGSLRSGVTTLGDNMQNLRQSKTAQQKTTLNADGTRTVNYFDTSAGYEPKATGASQTYDAFGNLQKTNGQDVSAPNTYYNLPNRAARSAYQGATEFYNNPKTSVSKAASNLRSGVNSATTQAQAGLNSAGQAIGQMASNAQQSMTNAASSGYNAASQSLAFARRGLSKSKVTPEESSVLTTSEDQSQGYDNDYQL